MTRESKITIGISVFSLLVALSTLGWTIFQNIVSKKENLIIRDITKYGFEQESAVFSIVNNGQTQVYIKGVRLAGGTGGPISGTSELEIDKGKKLEPGQDMEVVFSYQNKLKQNLNFITMVAPLILEVESARGNIFKSKNVYERLNVKLTKENIDLLTKSRRRTDK